jgi:hypothetical protein
MTIMQPKDVVALPTSSKCNFCQTAERIRVRHNQQITAIIETGRELLALKEQFGDDQFNIWVKAHSGITERIARKYMRVAVDFGDKIEVVSDLPTAILFRLSARSTPVSVRQIVLTYLSTGWPITPDEIKDLIRKGVEAEWTARRDERYGRITPRQRAVRAQQKAEAEVRQQRWQLVR